VSRGFSENRLEHRGDEVDRLVSFAGEDDRDLLAEPALRGADSAIGSTDRQTCCRLTDDDRTVIVDKNDRRKPTLATDLENLGAITVCLHGSDGCRRAEVNREGPAPHAYETGTHVSFAMGPPPFGDPRATPSAI